MSLSATDSLNIIGYYGEMELPTAEKKVRIVMAEQFQGTVEKYYETVRMILSDERTSKRKKDLLLAAAVLSLKNAYLSIFDKYYSAYINAAGTGGGEPYSGSDAWKRRRAYDFALWITQTAQREPNLAFSESHAAAVTRTEVNAVCNLAAMDAAYRQGKRFKTWKTFGDLKVRPSHKAANGQRVPLDMPFTVGGYEMMFPNDNSLGAPAGEVVNCRCVLEFDDGKVLTNSDRRGIMKTGSEQMNDKRISNVYTGIRNEIPLTSSEKEFVTKYLTALNVDMDKVVFTDVYRTAYNEKFDAYIIGTDVKPLENAKYGVINANQRISIKGTLAHEVIGHREAHIKGWTQYDDVLEEVQASIRAARFAPNLSNQERITLLMDARSRLGRGRRLKDVRALLHIDER